MDQLIDISLNVNGEAVSARISPRTNLVDFLRIELDLTGTHVGCEHGVCGACTVRVDDAIVRGCLMLAAQVDGLLRVPVVYSSEQWGGTADTSLHPGRGGEKTVTTRTAGK